MITKIKTLIPNIVKRNLKGFARNVVDTFCYYIIDGRLWSNNLISSGTKISSVIFVCKGNVCRSAFAEQRFRILLNGDSIAVDSCGIDVDQGNFPPADSVQVAGEYSCSLVDRRAKGLKQCDIMGADLILPVEYWQYKKLIQLYPQKKKEIVLLRSLAPFPYFLFCNISDPYGWGLGEFQRCYSLINICLKRLCSIYSR